MRFWEKVDKTPGLGPQGECWLWHGGRRGSRVSKLSDTFYGGFKYGDKVMLAHRVAYILTRGPLLNNIKLRHDCDMPGCVNPTHLIPGDQGDNMRDCRDKGRNADALLRLGQSKHPRPRGERHRLAKLTQAKVIDIRSMFSSGKYNKSELSRKFGVTPQAIHALIKGKTWNHVGASA